MALEHWNSNLNRRCFQGPDLETNIECPTASPPMGRFLGQQNRRWCCPFIPALTAILSKRGDYTRGKKGALQPGATPLSHIPRRLNVRKSVENIAAHYTRAAAGRSIPTRPSSKEDKTLKPPPIATFPNSRGEPQIQREVGRRMRMYHRYWDLPFFRREAALSGMP